MSFGLNVRAVVRDVRGHCPIVRRFGSTCFDVGTWEFPGGKVEPGESFDLAIERATPEGNGETRPGASAGGAAILVAADNVLPRLLGAVLCLSMLGCHNPRLDLAALRQVLRPVHYNGSYYQIPYPGGDVPDSVGVCTDVIIRAYRRLGVDLQKEVHEDILAAPREYGITAPDTDTDHRWVRNLRVFLRRRGASLPVTMRAADYWDGDLVT